jgi:lipid A ethanolaminephosphotransferase
MNLLPRRRFSLTALTAFVALWCLLALNLPLWSHLLGLHPLTGPRDFAFLLSFAVLAGLAINLFLTPLTLIRPLAKPLLAAVLVLAAAASYFINVYGAVIDKVMIRNVLETNAAESVELLSGRMLLQVALLGVLPAVLVFRTSIAERGWRGELRDRGIATVATLVLLGGVAAIFYQDYASLLRNHRELRHMLVPVNFLAGLGSHIGEKLESPQSYTRIGEDARRPDPAATGEARKPMLVVLVVGETARAANFQLGGYARPTNPALSRIEDLVYFRDVSSCGTSTAISVPCLFSDLGRAAFDAEDAKHRDNLIDISLRAGLEVHWFGNNTDCKGVCRSVPERRVDRALHPEACLGDRPCLDGALFEDFFGSLGEIGRDRFTVIHTLGSHGPGYHLRYPAEFERFTPACREVDFARCTAPEIVNAYDNTLLYDDHLLAQTIDRLRALSRSVDTALVYVSDHGESLGENGVFLHALPYALAPRTQTQVPMMFWASAGFRSRFGIDIECLRRESDHSLSHDHLFHSLLDLLSTETKARRPELDFLSNCRTMTRQKPAT